MTTTDEADTRNAVHELLAMYKWIDEASNTTVEKAMKESAGDKKLLASLLKLHQTTIKLMKAVEDEIQAAMLKEEWKYGGEAVEGVGTVLLYKKGKKEKYDNPLLIGQIASILSDRVSQADPETGELPPPAFATQMAVETFADLVGARTEGFKSWRKGEAAANGIDLKRYCTVEGGELAVRIEG